MSAGTKIQWTDSTHNFWRGCTKVSPGCANCYAEVNIGVKMHGVKWGPGKPRVLSQSFDAPLAWNKRPWVCERCGEFVADRKEHDSKFACDSGEFHRHRVFSLSLGDWLDDEVPIEWLARMLNVIWRCPHLTWQLLTKRPENFFTRLEAVFYSNIPDQFEEWLSEWIHHGNIPKNIWIGASIENQPTADKRIIELHKIPAALRFLSVEPLLENVKLKLDTIDIRASWPAGKFPNEANTSVKYSPSIGWVIVGGESGPRARLCELTWIRDIVQQCAAARVPVFVKQMGSRPARWEKHEREFGNFGRCDPFNDKKGGDINEWPGDLQIRQMPAEK